MDTRYRIRMAYEDDWQDAIGLAWRTFLEFEAGEYPEEGVKNFRDFVTDPTLYRLFRKGEYQMFCAFDTAIYREIPSREEGRTVLRERMAGMLTLRNTSHISLLFVDKEYHRRGIGSELVNSAREYLLGELGCDRMTVNAAPYGIPFYRHMGFRELDAEQKKDGIIYTPMMLFL